MKALTWKPILSNLTEANGELKKLCWRLHFLAFGELPDDCPDHADASCVAWYARREKCCPFAEGSLFVGLEHVYHHLNWSWNCRHTPEERVWHFADNDADRWTKFPDTADFSELWPPDKTVKVDKDDFRLTGSRRKICLNAGAFRRISQWAATTCGGDVRKCGRAALRAFLPVFCVGM